MRLSLSLLPASASPRDFYSSGNDKMVWRWSRNGEALNKAIKCNEAIITMHWSPFISQGQGSGNLPEVFTLGFSDGCFSIIIKGREEKRVQAHKGAILCLKWSFDGTALASGGEDGLVKIWSRKGMLRSTLVDNEHPVYSLSWSMDSNQILFSCGKWLTIKSLQSQIQLIQWESHRNTVKIIDWNHVNNLIISAGEDNCYKVWDCYGRLVYESESFDFQISAISWSPTGEFFAVGSGNMIFLCYQTGCILLKETMYSGSFHHISWSMEGMQIAGATDQGSVVFGHLNNLHFEMGSFNATVESFNKIKVHDFRSGHEEKLEFLDIVVKICLGFGYLIVATLSQCFIYATEKWRAPHIMDLDGSIVLLMQCQQYFLTVNCASGIQMFSYQGRKISEITCPGLCLEVLNENIVTISNRIVAIIDSRDFKKVRFFESNTGKLLGDVLHHSVDIISIGLSQQGNISQQKISFIDRNQDLYISSITGKSFIKLGAIAEQIKWNDEIDVLAARVDRKLVLWFYPHVAFFDKDLLNHLRIAKEEYSGNISRIRSFFGSKCYLCLQDGSPIICGIPAQVLLLFQKRVAEKWDEMIRLCRYLKDIFVWACLASMAVESGRIEIAEEAYAALDEVDKVDYLQSLRSMSSNIAIEAAMALFKREMHKAESILLQAGLIYQAIEMNVKLHKWERALDIAIKHKMHRDTVLWYRQSYLMETNQEEEIKLFLKLSNQVTIDVEKIKHKIQEEISKVHLQCDKMVLQQSPYTL